MEKLTVSNALDRLAKSGADFSRLLERGTFDVGLYKPAKVDVQQAHKRDELYVIAAGTGTFECGGEKTPFAPGDALFVPAQVDHRFRDFTDDFCTWVIFFGARPS